MISLLNVGSLLLGLVAWSLPLISVIQKQKNIKFQNMLLYSILSFSACTIALHFQILYNNHLVKIEDWSAILDTSWAVSAAASILLVVTILLNAYNLYVYTKSFRE